MTAAQQTTLLTEGSLAAVTGIGHLSGSHCGVLQGATSDPEVPGPRVHCRARQPASCRGLQDAARSGVALKISYDAEERALRVVGILSADERGCARRAVGGPGLSQRREFPVHAAHGACVARTSSGCWMPI